MKEQPHRNSNLTEIAAQNSEGNSLTIFTKMKKQPWLVSQLVGMSSRDTKVLGSNPSQGTYKKQTITAQVSGTAH